jgi:hypothetical protein
LKKYHQELLRESRQKEIKQENNEFGMEEGMKGTKKYLPIEGMIGIDKNGWKYNEPSLGN